MAVFSAGSEPAALCSVPFLFTSASLRPNRHPSLCPQCHGNDPALPRKLLPLTPPPTTTPPRAPPAHTHTHTTHHTHNTHTYTHTHTAMRVPCLRPCDQYERAV